MLANALVWACLAAWFLGIGVPRSNARGTLFLCAKKQRNGGNNEKIDEFDNAFWGRRRYGRTGWCLPRALPQCPAAMRPVLRVKSMNENNPLTSEEKAKVDAAFVEGRADFSETKLTEVLNESDTAHEKAAKHLTGFSEEFKLVWSLLTDYRSGAYRDVPWKFIAAAGFAVLYLVNPLDVIPDVLPVVGYVDDVYAFGIVLRYFSINKFAFHRTR